MYTADALASEIRRGTSRSAFHSISISGRDPLSNVEYICAAFDKLTTTIPVMLDCDGQRPAEIEQLKRLVALTQVTLDGPTLEAQSERAFESLQVAAGAGMQHALVLLVDERTTDANVLRAVEAGPRDERSDGDRDSPGSGHTCRSGSSLDDVIRARGRAARRHSSRFAAAAADGHALSPLP
jgi:hypothetical protein